MLMKKERDPFFQFLRAIDMNCSQCWRLPGQTLYRDSKKNVYLSRREINKQIMIFPYGFHQQFVKAQHWERLRCRPRLPVYDYHTTCFWELKFTEEEEFAHWSTQEWPTERKRLEWDNFLAIQSGDIDSDRFQPLPPAFLDEEVADCPYHQGRESYGSSGHL